MKILAIIFIVAMVALALLGVIGWVKNLVKFTQLDFKEPVKAEIIRGVGLTPIGAIIGWININDY